MRYPAKQFRSFIDTVLLDLLAHEVIQLSDLAVAMYLMIHADEDKFTIKSKNISKKTKLCDKTVRTCLNRLAQAKVIEINKHKGKANGYSLGRLFKEAVIEYTIKHKTGGTFDAPFGEGEVFKFTLKRGF